MAAKRIMLLIAITVLLIASTTVPALALLQKGNPAPNFQLTDLSGKVHTLSDYRGKVVVIDFFGYACGYCISDAKTSLVPMYNTYYKNDAKVQFLGVEVNGVSNALIQQFVQQTGVPWPVGSGGSRVGPAYQIEETPTLYVIDPAGNVALTMLYPTNVQTLKSTIDALEGSGAPVVPAPAVCARGSNSLDLFAKGANGALWWKHWDGTTWSTSTSLGGVLTSGPAATSSGTGNVSVFVRGTNGALYERTTTNGGASWSNWISLGGQIPAGTGPAACSWGSGRLDLFVEGMNGALYHKGGTGTWSGWQNLGGYLTSSPAATSPGNGQIDVFVRGGNGAVYQRYWPNSGSWSNWISLGGQIPAGTGPAACSWGSGRLDLFVEGMNGALYHKGGTGTWSGWQSLGGKLTSSPAAASAPGSSRIDVVVRGDDNGLWQKTYNAGWSVWTSIGGM
jgi:peroxiredoxin